MKPADTMNPRVINMLDDIIMNKKGSEKFRDESKNSKRGLVGWLKW
jgi:hypothetical protein